MQNQNSQPVIILSDDEDDYEDDPRESLRKLARLLKNDKYPDLSQLLQGANIKTAKSLMLEALNNDFALHPNKRVALLKITTADLSDDPQERTLNTREKLAKGVPLDNAHAIAPTQRPPSSVLDRLPVEILRMMFLDMDLQSLTILRSLGSRFRAVIDGLPEYAAIVRHAESTFRAILATEMGDYLSLRKMMHILQDRVCHMCDDFGERLYLP